MSSNFCQAKHSCLDPVLLEPRSLIHHSTPSKQDLSFPLPKKPNNIPSSQNQNISPIEKASENKRKDEVPTNGWNLIQSLTKNSCIDPEPVYVHPLVKRSTSSLSTRSLEMCTESLGSETGTGIDSSPDFFSCPVFDKKQSYRQKTRESCKKEKQSKTFPPPLTSRTGNVGVQVQAHREGGRLVIKAFTFSSCSSYFKAERENGRLRLSLIKNLNRDGEENVDEEEEAKEGKGYDGNFNGCVWGGEWASTSIRCNGGDRGGGKRLPSLPFCVAIS